MRGYVILFYGVVREMTHELPGGNVARGKFKRRRLARLVRAEMTARPGPAELHALCTSDPGSALASPVFFVKRVTHFMYLGPWGVFVAVSALLPASTVVLRGWCAELVVAQDTLLDEIDALLGESADAQEFVEGFHQRDGE